MLEKIFTAAVGNRIGNAIIVASLTSIAVTRYYREKAVQQLRADARKYGEDVEYNRNLLKEVVALREAVDKLRKKPPTYYATGEPSPVTDV